MIRPMGFAAIVAFSPAIAVLTVPISDTIFGMIVMIVPTEDMTFPTMISTGPIAATTSATVTMIFCVRSSRLFSQSTKL